MVPHRYVLYTVSQRYTILLINVSLLHRESYFLSANQATCEPANQRLSWHHGNTWGRHSPPRGVCRSFKAGNFVDRKASVLLHTSNSYERLDEWALQSQVHRVYRDWWSPSCHGAICIYNCHSGNKHALGQLPCAGPLCYSWFRCTQGPSGKGNQLLNENKISTLTVIFMLYNTHRSLAICWFLT